MRLASKVRMNLSDRRNNNPWEHPGNGPNSATVYLGSIAASAPASIRHIVVSIKSVVGTSGCPLHEQPLAPVLTAGLRAPC